MTDLHTAGKRTKSIRWCFTLPPDYFVVFPDNDPVSRLLGPVDWRTLDWVSKTFGWYYLLAATLILSLWSVSLVRVLVR